MDADQNVNEAEKQTHSGFVSLIGRPNVGKSTLINQLLGEKIVITSPKPQTTRNRIVGVLNQDACQIVFFDTPGVHQGEKLINRYMASQALATLDEVEIAVLMVDAKKGPTPDDASLADLIAARSAAAMVAVNKVDAGGFRIPDFAHLLPGQPIHEISALTGAGVDALLTDLVARMPEGPWYYPEDALTDRAERFLAAELIREQVFRLTGEEIPYATAVTIDTFKEKKEGRLVNIEATIHLERDSQKGMVIGKKGSKLKQIGIQSREQIEKMMGCKIYLKLFVRIQKNWRKDTKAIRKFGY